MLIGGHQFGVAQVFITVTKDYPGRFQDYRRQIDGSNVCTHTLVTPTHTKITNDSSPPRVKLRASNGLFNSLVMTSPSMLTIGFLFSRQVHLESSALEVSRSWRLFATHPWMISSFKISENSLGLPGGCHRATWTFPITLWKNLRMLSDVCMLPAARIVCFSLAFLPLSSGRPLDRVAVRLLPCLWMSRNEFYVLGCADPHLISRFIVTDLYPAWYSVATLYCAKIPRFRPAAF